jgi:hydrogenase maturation protein HypF
MVSQRIRTLVRISGIVQGVGFRPFVYSLARGLGLGGLVGNDTDGVFAEVEGAPEVVAEFVLALKRDAPPLASIERIATTPLRPHGSTSFSIAPSQAGGPRRTLIAADTATCDDCLTELGDPADRRFGYPFINCTNCGPRYTIVTSVPRRRWPASSCADHASGSTTTRRTAASMPSRRAAPTAATAPPDRRHRRRTFR